MSTKTLFVYGTARTIITSEGLRNQPLPYSDFLSVFTLGATDVQFLDIMRDNGTPAEIQSELLRDRSNGFSISLTDAEYEALSKASSVRVNGTPVPVVNNGEGTVEIDITSVLESYVADLFLLIDFDTDNAAQDVFVTFGSYSKRIGYISRQTSPSLFRRLFGVLMVDVIKHGNPPPTVLTKAPIVRISPTGYQDTIHAHLIALWGSDQTHNYVVLPVEVLGIDKADATTHFSFVSADVTALGRTATNDTVYRGRTYRAASTANSTSFGNNVWYKNALVTGELTRRPDLDDISAVDIDDAYTTSVLSFVNQTDGKTYTVAIEGVYDFPNDEPAQPAQPAPRVVTRDNLGDVFDFNEDTKQVSVKVDNTTLQKGANGLQLAPRNTASVPRLVLTDVAGQTIAYVPVSGSNN